MSSHLYFEEKYMASTHVFRGMQHVDGGLCKPAPAFPVQHTTLWETHELLPTTFKYLVPCLKLDPSALTQKLLLLLL